MREVSGIEHGLGPTGHGYYEPVTVEMHDTVGAIALGIVSVLLLWVFLRRQAQNQVLTEALVRQRELLRPPAAPCILRPAGVTSRREVGDLGPVFDATNTAAARIDLPPPSRPSWAPGGR